MYYEYRWYLIYNYCMNKKLMLGLLLGIGSGCSVQAQDQEVESTVTEDKTKTEAQSSTKREPVVIRYYDRNFNRHIIKTDCYFDYFTSALKYNKFKHRSASLSSVDHCFCVLGITRVPDSAYFNTDILVEEPDTPDEEGSFYEQDPYKGDYYPTIGVEDSLFGLWVRVLESNVCPPKYLEGYKRIYTQDDYTKIADAFIKAPGIVCSQHIFEGWAKALVERGLANRVAVPQEALKTAEQLTEEITQRIDSMLQVFGVEDDLRKRVLETLANSFKNKYIVWASGEEDINFLVWKEIMKSVNPTMACFGGGCCEHPYDDALPNVWASLDMNNPDEAFILLMHELGHAYDFIKYKDAYHDEQISVLFELATALSSQDLFNTYLNSKIFLSRGLQYPLFVLVDMILRGRVDWMREIVPQDLLTDKKALVRSTIEELAKDDRLASAITAMESSPTLKSILTKCVNMFFDSLIRKNDFLIEDSTRYTVAFMKAYEALKESASGKPIVELSESVTVSPMPTSVCDFDLLQQAYDFEKLKKLVRL